MIEIREIDVPDLERWIAIVNAATPEEAATVSGIVDWRRQAEDMLWLLAECDDRDAGAAVGIVGWHSPPGVGRARAHVLPEFRGQGIGTALYEELLRWVAERGCIELDTNVREDDPDSLAWANRRGFREIGRNSTLVLDLAAIEAPEAAAPAGVEIVQWSERPELAEGLYVVALEAYPDVPGEEGTSVGTLEQWLDRDMRGSGDRPEAVFAAVAGGEVVAYAKLSLAAEDPVTAWHDMTGVRREWRGRGIAGALKRTEIAWAKEQGYRWLKTRNEERNEPIRRLNERHGYRVEPGEVVLRCYVGGVD